MSHLSRKQVAQTSLLSKKFKDELLPSFPILIFDQADFLGIDPLFRGTAVFLIRLPRINPESIKEFTQFVDATLSRFNEMKLRIDKFKLKIGITSDLESRHCRIDEWIGLALENQVRKLHLRVMHQNRPYPLPQTVFLAKSITVLSLYGCELDHFRFNKAFGFQLLRKLKLCEVSLDKLMIQKLTSNCPLLEHISLEECFGFAYCHVPKLERLKIFNFSTVDGQWIEITAPSLDKCTIDWFREAAAPLDRRISLVGRATT